MSCSPNDEIRTYTQTHTCVYMISLFLFYSCTCFAFMYDCAQLACCAHKGNKRWKDPLGLEIQLVVSFQVGAGNKHGSWAEVESPLNFISTICPASENAYFINSSIHKLILNLFSICWQDKPYSFHSNVK